MFAAAAQRFTEESSPVPKRWIITIVTPNSGLKKCHIRKEVKLIWSRELEPMRWSEWLWSCYWKVNVDFVNNPQHRSILVIKAAPDWPHMELHDAIQQHLQSFSFTCNIQTHQACVVRFKSQLLHVVVADWYHRCEMGRGGTKVCGHTV